MITKIFPTTLQVVDKIMALMDPENGVVERLKEYNMLEKVPLIILYCEGWPDFEQYRYQPRTVAHCVAMAEAHISILDDIQADKEWADDKIKQANRRLQTKIKQATKITGKNFRDLPYDIQNNILFGEIEPYVDSKRKDEKPPAALAYWAADKMSEDAKYCRARLLREPTPDDGDKKATKPKEKALADFCRDMAALFHEKRFHPNYRLIADISNLFELSKIPQTYDSIRKRFSRNHI